MIAKFKYSGFDVTISDSEGVSCNDPETKKSFRTQFEMHCDGPTESPAGIIGSSLEKLGIDVEFLDDGIIY